ncbi:gamma-glutamyl-gamma-aminobutyrate hydrolase family protein [Promethearchaeum syntrophicum]|uniref:Gamma-glutamyl-gamma-aminobutyrate hydrolase family protein n=1 Tax=Promethearchaeum syntrophicum TaxID=2594042 RepID=A0A5B9DA37_9ARCH|nr:gamma-glutamyl-gamma-aminobutyrate hydrolase family protein [Candidatus Prometheoarchaeum syntrophicum]QEE15707.1 GMP synthase (glutamine-hydrolyzing) subunit A [Candidatus Prometheoarchaeum syntrophicum]
MKNLGIIINFDKEIDKFKERFNNSFKNCEEQLIWEYIHYSQLNNHETHDILKKMDGLLLTGSYQMLSDKKIIEKYQTEKKIIREYEKPILGICFGIHLIACAFGFEIIAINNTDTNIENEKSLFLNINPNFELFPTDQIHVYESHFEEIKFVPKFLEIFTIYASSPSCKIQIIKHKSQQIFGVQFHPEYPDDPLTFKDGTILLNNFINLL